MKTVPSFPPILVLAVFSFHAFVGCAGHTATAATLNIPPRQAGALTGSQIVAELTPLSLTDRENRIFQEITSGNVPDFMRTLVPVTVTAEIGGQTLTAVYHVIPDYLALGSDADYFLCPMTPLLAQRLCDQLGCILPTRKMVNDIWAAAPVHLAPQPIPPSPEMTTVPVFAQHNTMVWESRSAVLNEHPLGALVGGDKKDVVITARLVTQPGRVAIYGWHYQNGTPIQPLSLVHSDTYADYSHGIRLVAQAMTVDGQPTTVDAVLRDAVLNPLLSDEGALTQTRYDVPLPSLVTNGSFEDGFTGGVGNGWISWQAPDSNPITFGQASVNRHDGAYSQYWSRNDTQTFLGGLYQTVTLTPGHRYRLEAWMKRQSTIAGTIMAFGFDPGGGTNGTAASVVYTDITGTANDVWVPYSAEFTATGAAVTIFAKGGHTGTSGGSNSYFYLDQVSLISLGPAPEPTPSPTPAPTPTQTASVSGFVISGEESTFAFEAPHNHAGHPSVRVP